MLIKCKMMTVLYIITNVNTWYDLALPSRCLVSDITTIHGHITSGANELRVTTTIGLYVV